jgi:Spy/CpxP family protein refolding chaperone
MKKSLWMLALLIVFPLLVWSQTDKAPYAGQESRQVKALSEEEVQAYLNGRGMGLAKAAELNSYPGPMHVLELAAQLQLSEAQRAETQKTFERMRGEAVRLGRLVVEKETELNRLFAEGKVDADNLRLKVGEIARLQGELRVVHLRAHVEVKRVLSPQQVKKYDELRGYAGGEGGHQHKQHGHGE